MRRTISLLVWLVLLEGLWTLFTGTKQATELVAGLGAAALGALLAEVLRSRGPLAYTADLQMLPAAWKLLWQAPFDFALAAWVLVRSLARGQRVRGELLTVPFESGDGPVGRWRRAYGATVGSVTPNAIVLDLDAEQALLHVLEPRVSTGRRVL